MKRAVLLVIAFLLIPAFPAQAQGHNAKPRVTIQSIDALGGGDYRITIGAVDPDGVISEFALDFGDGVQVSILLACDPDTTQPGDPLTYEINWSYAPGKYKLVSWGYSTPECFTGDLQTSRRDRDRLRVA